MNPESRASKPLRTLLSVACCLLAACASTPGPEVGGTGRCNDDALDWAVGRPADEANMRRLSRESGAGLVNPIGPDSLTRADHRNDRLRVYIDAENVIRSARCE